MIWNDADIEAFELGQRAEEDANETCGACGEIGCAITLPSADRAVELYECGCGHVTVFLCGRRVGV